MLSIPRTATILIGIQTNIFQTWGSFYIAAFSALFSGDGGKNALDLLWD